MENDRDITIELKPNKRLESFLIQQGDTLFDMLMTLERYDELMILNEFIDAFARTTKAYGAQTGHLPVDFGMSLSRAVTMKLWSIQYQPDDYWKTQAKLFEDMRASLKKSS